jgi:hypothetical protein
LLLLLPALLLAGCSDERTVGEDELASMAGGELKETVPVSGTVHVDGLPAEDVFIFAYPKGDVTSPVAQVQTKPDGTYCWTTYAMCDGLPPGEYTLAFAYIPDEGKGKKEGEDLLGGKYRDPSKSEFSLQVASGAPQTNVNYELQP